MECDSSSDQQPARLEEMANQREPARLKSPESSSDVESKSDLWSQSDRWSRSSVLSRFGEWAERLKVQNKLARRRILNKIKEQKEEAEQEVENQRHAGSSYASPETEEIDPGHELSGLPWGGISLRHVVEAGKSRTRTLSSQPSSRENAVYSATSYAGQQEGESPAKLGLGLASLKPVDAARFHGTVTDLESFPLSLDMHSQSMVLDQRNSSTNTPGQAIHAGGNLKNRGSVVEGRGREEVDTVFKHPISEDSGSKIASVQRSEDEDERHVPVDSMEFLLETAMMRLRNLTLREFVGDIYAEATDAPASSSSDRTQANNTHQHQTSTASTSQSSETRQPQKRARGGDRDPDDGDGDPDDDEDDDRPRKRNPKRAADRSPVRRLKCPFFQRKPGKYSRNACQGKGFADMAKLKDHIKRVHTQPLRCSRCWEDMGSEHAYAAHLQVGRDDLCELRPMPPDDRISLLDLKRLDFKKSPFAHAKNTEEKWAMLYRELFPRDRHIPSPYDLPGIDPRLEQVLFEVLEEELFKELDPVLGPLRDRIKKRLPSIIQSCKARLSNYSTDTETIYTPSSGHSDIGRPKVEDRDQDPSSESIAGPSNHSSHESPLKDALEVPNQIPYRSEQLCSDCLAGLDHIPDSTQIYLETASQNPETISNAEDEAQPLFSQVHNGDPQQSISSKAFGKRPQPAKSPITSPELLADWPDLHETMPSPKPLLQDPNAMYPQWADMLQTLPIWESSLEDLGIFDSFPN